MCIYTDNVCNQISFPQFVREAKYEKSVHSWWKKECGIKYCVFNKHTALPVIQFSHCDIFIQAPRLLYILWYGIGGAHSGEES
jgi:hypothetical protein